MKKYHYEDPTFKLEGSPGVPLLNFAGGPWVPLFNFEGGSRGPGPTFTPCLRKNRLVTNHCLYFLINISKSQMW